MTGFVATADADEIPEYMRNVIVPLPMTSPKAVALRDALALDDQMQVIYSSSLQTYKKNLLATSPVILGLFSNQGGEFYLNLPGKPVMQAPRVPVGYEICKSCGHSAMAVYQLTAPYLDNPKDPSWRTPMAQYLALQEATLAGFENIDLSEGAKNSAKTLLMNNIAFMKECLKNGTFTAEDLRRFTSGQRGAIEGVVEYAARAQASHWMKVMADWKTLIGKDWNKTYGATNTLYVTRTNNILFTIMAQFFGREAFNDRLLLLETTNFTTTPDQMIEELARIVSDRALGRMFFNNYYLMDTELVSNQIERPAPAARGGSTVSSSFTVIEEECRKLGLKPLMPPLAPFHSQEWPWRTDASQGSGPKTLREALKDKNPDGSP
ncbi:MAG: hypothetical protein ACLP9L_03440 [Thermoguttaceae bacterium]